VSDPLEFRLILHDRASGRLNMAIDHALLDGVGRPGARPVLRLYGFAPPALSLGRFQRAREVLDVQALARDGLDVVRRPSGGQAVLHDGELTYSAILGREHLRPFSKRSAYRLVAEILQRALGKLGLDLRSAGERRGDLHNPDCFRTTGEYELADGRGRKLVGSAQTVTRDGALQHGAIPLDESNRSIARYLRAAATDRPAGAAGGIEAHDSASVSALLGRPVAFDWFRDELARSLASTVRVRPDELDAFERDRADSRLRELYGSDRWNLEP
jgi:lipoyl(octanoyl) transferase